ncbi:hypothetical protein [Thiolapillus sp.]
MFGSDAPDSFRNGMSDTLEKALNEDRERILREFSLDTGDSALARMRKELLDVVEQHRKDATLFQQEVRIALAEMSAQGRGGTQHHP